MRFLLPFIGLSVAFSVVHPVRAQRIACGWLNSLCICADGTGNAWGQGLLGNDSLTDSEVPLVIVGLEDLTSISYGGYHGLAIRADSTLWAWGNNDNGQLGNGSTLDNPVPIQVLGLPPVVECSAGGEHSMALAADGTVWTWGKNQHGELGHGTQADTTLPVMIAGLEGVISISASTYEWSMALKSDGTVWSWGSNTNGHLGDGTTENRDTPVQVVGLSGITGIAAITSNGYALAADSTVWAWGVNVGGGLGNGEFSENPALMPVQVIDLSGVIALGRGSNGYHCLAIRSDHTLWGWGGNYNGALGDGTTEDSNVPVQVLGLTDIVEAAMGASHSLALKSDGSLWGWGWNNAEQLADTVLMRSLVPIPIEEGCEMGTTNSLAEQAVHDPLRVFPDPTTGPVWIKEVTKGVTEVEVLNSYGSLVLRQRITPDAPMIDLSTLTPAVYHIVLLRADGRSIGRVIKQ